MPKDSPILKMNNISISFGGLQALRDINIETERNTVHGIIGPNGAGKTTLFNIVTGIYKPTTGQIFMEEKDMSGIKPHQLVTLGISRTFQNIRLFQKMSVIDNVLIGQHTHSPTPVLSILVQGKKAAQAESAARERAMEALNAMGMAHKAEDMVANLSYGQQRLIEFARALAAQPKVILLDEPAAGMNPTEKANLFNIITKLRDQGYTFVLIEHDMKLVMNICDTISVLDHGQVISQGKAEEVRNNPDVISAYLGRRKYQNARD